MKTVARRSSGTPVLCRPSRLSCDRRLLCAALSGLTLALSLALSGCVDDTISQLVFTPPGGGNRSAFSYAAVAVSGTTSCLVTDGGKARCWGLAPLGDGQSSDSTRPVGVTGGTSFLQLDVTSGVRCGLSVNQVILCWGSNFRGQLGTGTTESSEIPIEANTDLRFTQISAGGQTVCGIDLNRDAWCWGRNHHGQLGIASPDSMRLLPSPVAGGLKFESIAVGFHQACGIASDGAPYCWGRLWGDEPRPVDAPVLFETVSGRSETFCGLTASGEAWCWGSNVDGQFGNGERDEAVEVPPGTISDEEDPYHMIPQRVLTELRFSQLAVGGLHVCGIETETRQAYCWGSDSRGQLGDGPPPGGAGEISLTPVRVRLSRRFTHISVASAFSCATTTESTAFCWGRMVWESESRDEPVEVG